jgi:hypothetical protein
VSSKNRKYNIDLASADGDRLHPLTKLPPEEGKSIYSVCTDCADSQGHAFFTKITNVGSVNGSVKLEVYLFNTYQDQNYLNELAKAFKFEEKEIIKLTKGWKKDIETTGLGYDIEVYHMKTLDQEAGLTHNGCTVSVPMHIVGELLRLEAIDFNKFFNSIDSIDLNKNNSNNSNLSNSLANPEANSTTLKDSKHN